MMRNDLPPGSAGRSVIVFRTPEKCIDSLVCAMGLTRLAILVMFAAMLPTTTSTQVDESRWTGTIAGVIIDSISGKPIARAGVCPAHFEVTIMLASRKAASAHVPLTPGSCQVTLSMHIRSICATHGSI
jgi:hypothetical protein